MLHEHAKLIFESFLVFSELYEITTLRSLYLLFRLKGIGQKTPSLKVSCIQ